MPKCPETLVIERLLIEDPALPGFVVTEQLSQTQALDGQMAQGYLFSRPVLPEKCEAMLAAGKNFGFRP